MAEYLDLNFLCRDYVGLDTILCSLNALGLDCSVQSIVAIENWQWENETSLRHADEIYAHLNRAHIVFSRLSVGAERDGNIIIEAAKGLFHYELSVDISPCMAYVDQKFLDLCCRLLSAINEASPVTLAAVGIEAMFRLCPSLADTVKHSHGIDAWLFPKAEDVGVIDGYVRTEPSAARNFIQYGKCR